MKVSNHEKNIDINNQDEIDLRKYFNLFKRNKILIGLITALGTSCGIVYSLLDTPIYRGSFEIIVDDRNEKNVLSNSSSTLENLTNFVGKNSDNKTQEAILKSPSVLKPVYELVKKEESKTNPNLKNISYKKWLKSFLKIEFEDGTNVLSIQYKNADKELIISTLNLISTQYQEYSMKDRERSIRQGIEYLEIQKNMYEEKSEISLKKLNQFSIDNGLGDIDGFVELGSPFGNKVSKDLNRFLNIEGGKNGNLNYKNFELANSGAGLRYGSQFALLEKYQAQYIDLSSKLKPNSKILKSLDVRIENLKESLKRPNEILLEFRNLKRIASRDESMLANLEDNLSLLKLEKVKQLTPWELISEPTIDDSIVSPKRKQITILSFISSLIFVFFIALIKEKREDFIYEFIDFKENIPFNLLGICYKNYPRLNKFLFRKYLDKLKNKKNDVGLILLNNEFFEDKKPKKPEYLDQNINFNIVTKDNLEKINEIGNVILIAESKKITFKNLLIIITFLNTFDNADIEWVFIQNNITKII